MKLASKSTVLLLAALRSTSALPNVAARAAAPQLEATESPAAYIVERQLPLPTTPLNCTREAAAVSDLLTVCDGFLGTAALQCGDYESAGVVALTQCLMRRTNAQIYNGVSLDRFFST